MTAPRRSLRLAPLLLVAILGRSAAPRAEAAPAAVRVATIDALRAALAATKPGARILVAPGTYPGGTYLTGVRGAKGAPVVVAAADPAHPPLFRGGTTGIQLAGAEHVVLEDLAFSGQTGNGVGVDDGGARETPAHHVVLRRLSVADVGPQGNCDGIKLSGLDDFSVEACTVERWGLGGSAVDMVGCHRGTIEGCTFRHQADPEASSGVQMKGGSREVTVRRCRFEHAGARAVNAGGSTGLPYFRPPLEGWKGEKHEAKDLVVEGNTFVGGQAAVAFVGVDGAVVRFNTIYLPGRWALRILQETREAGFVACRGGVFTDNVVAFESGRWAEGGCNVGPGTDPASFRFARNVWCCVDAPRRTKALVRMPVEETGGLYGEDPRFVDAAHGDLGLRRGSPAAAAGAGALAR